MQILRSRICGRDAAFFLLLNTSPLNAAVINSVDAHIRATAIAANIFIIHISSAILFVGMKYAHTVRVDSTPVSASSG